MSLAIEPMCFSLLKFMLINLHHILNWWYSLGMKTMDTALYTIYKEILFSTLYMLSLMRNFSLNVLTVMQKSANYIISYLSGSQKVDLVSFYFLLDLFSIFSIFRTLGLGLEVIGHAVTSVTSDSVIITLIMELKRKK